MAEVKREYSPRLAYDTVLDSYLNTEPIKVLNGVRRCGKSSLLSMLASRLQA